MGLLNRKGAGAEHSEKVEKEIAVVNRLGLHARPAAMFVRIASRYRCEVWVDKEGEEVNGKSIMGLMMLAAGQGSKLNIRCEGDDASKAMRELEELIKPASTKIDWEGFHASTIALLSTEMSDEGAKAELRFQGVGVSPGIARGRTHVVRDDIDDVPRYGIELGQVSKEIARFEAALMQTRAQILEMQQRIAEAIGAKDASIFDAHLLVVEDRTLIDEVLRKLESDRCNVEYVFQEVARRYSETLSKIDDPYLRERAVDIQDVTRRVIRNLQGKAPKSFLAVT